MSTRTRLLLVVFVVFVVLLGADAVFSRRGGGRRGGGSRGRSRSRGGYSGARRGRGSVRHSGGRRSRGRSYGRSNYGRRRSNYGSVRNYSPARARVPSRSAPTGRKVVTGPRGGQAVVGRGPRGGTGGVVRGPAGGTAGRISGPRGGSVGGVRGPGGGAAGRISGPRGGAVGGVRGPRGYGAAGFRGPRGRGVVTNLPAGYRPKYYGGRNYYNYGYGWYEPYWQGNDVYYGWIYPPLGYYYSALPKGYRTEIIAGTTYYYADDVYYVVGEQEGQTGYVVAEAPTEEETPDPFEILQQMGKYMDQTQNWSFNISTTADEVLNSGQKIQVSRQRTFQVSRPNKLAVQFQGKDQGKRVVYDGQTVTMFDPSKDVYVRLDMPNTIATMLDTLAKDYGKSLPLADLLYRDPHKGLTAKAKTGQYIGLHTVDNDECHHLGFTQDNIDWEIWISAGDNAIPRKFSIVYKQQPGSPRYVAEISAWTVLESSPASVFELKLPADAKRIEMLPVASTN